MASAVTGDCLLGFLNFIVNSGTLALILATILKLSRQEMQGASRDELAERLADLEDRARHWRKLQ